MKIMQKYKTILENINWKFDRQTLVQAYQNFLNYLRNELKLLQLKLRNLKQTNYELGVRHYNLGNVYDAKLRFKLLEYCVGDFHDSQYYLGRCYFEGGDYAKAKNYLESYIKSGREAFKYEANYTLTAIAGKTEKIDHIPSEIVAHNNNYAATRNDTERAIEDAERLGIETAQVVMFKKLCEHLVRQSREENHRALDLGCGKGFIGQMIRAGDLCIKMIGVDISPRMLETTRDIKIDMVNLYDACYVGDAQTDLKKKIVELQHYSLITASLMLGGVSDIEGFVKNLEHLSESNTVVALLFRATTEKEREYNARTEEFFYNPNYVTKFFSSKKWKVLEDSKVEMADNGKIVLGHILLVQHNKVE
jgi:predicted TPR repeat methyltransferase